MGAIEPGVTETPNSHQIGFATVRVCDLEPREGQVRTYFDARAHEELVESIRAQGQLQAILCRPGEERLQIVAGERRWRAIRAIHGEEGAVKVEIRDMTDADADRAAIAENDARESNSPCEQADAAARTLAYVDGDRAEAARRLGWSLDKLSARLGLMACVPEVRKAVNERTIQLGHAELLSGIPAEKQPAFLASIIERNISVDDTKRFLMQAAFDLGSAPFDKEECNNCPHNSSRQVSLGFEANIGAGHCMSSACYDKRVSDFIDTVVKALSEEVPNVRVLTPGDVRKTIPLVAEGKTGVGKEQLEQGCAGCANFGASVSKLPGSYGEVTRSLCFDPACHLRKCAAHLKSQQPTSVTGTGATAASTKAATGTTAAPAKKPAAGAVSQRVKDYRLKAWRAAGVHAVERDNGTALSVFLAFALIDHGRNIKADFAKEALGDFIGEGKPPRAFAEWLALAHDRDIKAKAAAFSRVAASMAMGCDEGEIEKLLAFYKVSLSETWRLNAEFLDLLTKSEIEVVAKELGIKKALGEAFGKLLAGKKDELIKAVLAIKDFNYGAAVPSCMKYRGY